MKPSRKRSSTPYAHRVLLERTCAGCGRTEMVPRSHVSSLCWDCYVSARKSKAEERHKTAAKYERKCAGCGRTDLVVQRRSLSKLCRSCSKSTHGLSRTRLYKIWNGMIIRTTDPHFRFYPRYGGRGIKVCDEWSDVQTFIEWATAHGYAPELQIDRIDNDGDYAPNNCRWVIPQVNSRNRSTTKLSTLKAAQIREAAEDGEPIIKIAERYGVARRTVAAVIERQNWRG